MYCNKCGKEIMDEAVVCIHCGCAVNGKKEQWVEDKANAGLIILSVLIPLIGMILGIINLCNKKNSGGVYLGVALASWIIGAGVLFFTGLI